MSTNRCDKCGNLWRYCPCPKVGSTPAGGEPTWRRTPEPAAPKPKRCTDCQNHLAAEYGYSNYTVEGRYVYCILDLLPDAPIDDWYGREPKLEFAKTCPSFVAGDGATLDVDREDYEDLPDAHKAYWDRQDER